jgi:hypothetical protein
VVSVDIVTMDLCEAKELTSKVQNGFADKELFNDSLKCLLLHLDADAEVGAANVDALFQLLDECAPMKTAWGLISAEAGLLSQPLFDFVEKDIQSCQCKLFTCEWFDEVGPLLYDNGSTNPDLIQLTGDATKGAVDYGKDEVTYVQLNICTVSIDI